MKRSIAFLVLATSLAWAVRQYAICPQDGEEAAYTGQQRDQGRSCEYRHQHAIKGEGFVEHRFWASCE
jgi:hypothetical protein